MDGEKIAVCVFCASSDHIDGDYSETAFELATAMAGRGMTLVYGGGNNGLMGTISVRMHEQGGYIVGVIPEHLKDLGYAYCDVDEMIVTDGMRERKAMMEERADGFIGLPGGFGTMEELLEIVTLKQLRMLDKPIVFLNVNGYYDGLIGQFERGVRERFIPESNMGLFFVTDSVGEALDYIARENAKRPPAGDDR